MSTLLRKIIILYPRNVTTLRGTTPQGSIRKRNILFVSLSVKAVHIEAVSDLTSEACLRSDHGTNFVGILKELKNTNNGITWDFIPER